MDIQPVDLETIRSWGAEGKFLGGEDGGGDTGAYFPFPPWSQRETGKDTGLTGSAATRGQAG